MVPSLWESNGSLSDGEEEGSEVESPSMSSYLSFDIIPKNMLKPKIHPRIKKIEAEMIKKKLSKSKKLKLDKRNADSNMSSSDGSSKNNDSDHESFSDRWDSLKKSIFTV